MSLANVPEESRRIARALMILNPSPEDRQRIIDAVERANRFEDLPASIRQMIEEAEARAEEPDDI